MKYEKKFTKPYPGGYKDKPDLTTPVKAHILNMQDDTFEAIEDFLANLDVSTDLPDDVAIKKSLTVGSGNRATDSNTVSHGADCEASSPCSHAEGISCTASGQASHAEGIGTKASEYMAHSEGNGTVAGGAGSHAEGYGTVATANFQHVQGMYNVKDTEKKYAHIIGGGNSDSDRKNIHTVDWNGNAKFAGDVTNGNGVSLDALDGKIAELASSGISRLIVDSLPTEGIKTNVIYFLPLSSVGENNVYEEYMYINDKWELIGTTQVDLSQYYTKEESDGLLAEKANKTAFENHANDKDIHVTVAEKEKWNTEDIANAEVSDYLTIENSVAGGLKLNQLYGKSEQKHYSGKNLLNSKLRTTTQNGVTCTANGDGTYTLNGTATKETGLILLTFTEKEDRKYRLVGSPKSAGTNTYRLDIFADNEASKNDVGNGVTFGTNANKPYTIRILFFANVTMNNVIFKPMLTTDLTVTYDDFEPYVGGIPSPNPDYPQEIKTVVNPTVKVMGNGKEQSVTLTGVTLNAIPVPSGGNVTIDGQQYISDYVDAERGKIVRMVGKFSSDVNKTTVTATSSGGQAWYSFSADNLYDKSTLLSKEYLFVKNNDEAWLYKTPCITVIDAKQIRIYDSDSKTKVTANVYYQLATPTEEPLTSDQLEALQALQTYYPQTNVSVTSEELPPMVELEYGLSRVGGYTLEALNMAKNNAVKLNSLLSSQNESENTTNEQE